MKRVAVLGSTGSVGRQTLDVLQNLPGKFDIVALCAGLNTTLLEEQINQFRPRFYWHFPSAPSIEYYGAVKLDPISIAGCDDVDLVVSAVSGITGIYAAVAAIKAGKSVALATKEALVVAGQFIMKEAEENAAKILPLDSEPSALWQCLNGEKTSPKRLMLTASGGAFRDRAWSSLHNVSPQDALAHPTWKMGKRITIDSATLMNKAFEVIETRWLFGVPLEKIDVVIHRQSLVHSMVEFEDGTWKAQISQPDMRFPIAYALSWPERLAQPRLEPWNPIASGSLTFEAMIPSRYPCFHIAMDCFKRGGGWPAVLAGADEAGVELFLNTDIKFTDIPEVISRTLDEYSAPEPVSFEDAVAVAEWAKETTNLRESR